MYSSCGFQFFIASVALAILLMSFIMGYKGLCILSGIYGVGFGGFRFSLKMLALERVKLKFSKTWSFIKGIEAVPVLISVPLTIFLNDYSLKYGRAGYYICSAAAAISAIVIFFIGYAQYPQSTTRSQENGLAVASGRTTRSMSHQYVRNHLHQHQFYPAMGISEYHKANGCDYPAPDLINRSCISLNQLGESVSCLCGRMRNVCNCQTAYGLSGRIGTAGIHGHNQMLGGGNAVTARCLENQHPYMYDNGIGSYLRRSLSFIQNANCCGNNGLQFQCQANIQCSNRELR